MASLSAAQASAASGSTILLVGELAYNADRVRALAEAGHKRYGLWTRTPYWLSARDGEIHTVVPGRPIGLHPHTVAELAGEGIHLHFYGDFTHGQWRGWIRDAQALAPRHLHLHANVDQRAWRGEFSRYDAGWLHAFASTNEGELRRANWDDLNYPARLSTLAAAGLPMIQRDNRGAIVATQTLARALDIGVFYGSIAELADKLRDRPALDAIRARVEANRHRFSFDAHVPELVGFFREVIATARAGPGRRQSCVRTTSAPAPSG